jgi:uncharacterized protein
MAHILRSNISDDGSFSAREGGNPLNSHDVTIYSSLIMPLNDDPLSDEEFEELDEFLLSDRCPEDAMTMDSLHGFLTAIVIGPEPVAMAEWLPHVWGTEADGEPKFNSQKEQQRIMELLLRFMQEIAITFEVAPKEFEPLYCEHEWNGKMLIDGEGWAMGFWEGINLRPTAWEPIWSSELAPLLQPYYLLGADELDEDEEHLIDDPIKQHKLAIEAEANIHAIRRFWIERSKPDQPSAPSGKSKSAGGNGPCACGSGKKFKQCCGAEPVLH